MNIPRHHVTFSLVICVIILAVITIYQPPVLPAQAQGGDSAQATPLIEGKLPFGLPFASPPGPNTWLLAQSYGNTTSAYYQRHTLYGASGGIHFGLDLAAACGTEIVAIADGVVFAVDSSSYGSPPHNLMIDHPELGYASLYGHLLQAPSLRRDQLIKQGQVIALVGDSLGDCYRTPHLHLEIRDLKHFRKFNPLTLIDADWNRLALYSSWGRDFMRDLAEPRKWQNLYDQPEAQVGGPIINDFEQTWPPDWRKKTTDDEEANSTPGKVQQLALSTPVTESSVVETPVSESISQTLELSGTPAAALPSNVRQITSGNCCTGIFWSADSTEIHFIDRPSPTQPVGIWGVDIMQRDASPHLVRERLGVYSNDETLLAYPDQEQGLVIIERLADGQQWEIDTQESAVSFTPDGRLLWTRYDSEVPWEARKVEVWLADADGSNASRLAALDRGQPAAWMSDTDLLVAQRIPPKNDILLSTLSIEDGILTELVQLPRTRGSAFSPDKRFMVYLVRFNDNSDQNGIWLLDLQDPELRPQPLPFFGAYRWRDNQRLVYAPFDPDAGGLVFFEYNVISKQTSPLFPIGGLPLDLTIANNDWQISPDGSKIALVAAKGTDLDGIWVIELSRRQRKVNSYQ